MSHQKLTGSPYEFTLNFFFLFFFFLLLPGLPLTVFNYCTDFSIELNGKLRIQKAFFCYCCNQKADFSSLGVDNILNISEGFVNI